ncbi:STAS domain-containing protein [Streptomyces sp. NPDC006739]|uniref:STAS domain-containing protein n=1 Tax=Streptomyces sp. NPDC006739 TaxID=3364763 RepID=UPI0036CB47E2
MSSVPSATNTYVEPLPGGFLQWRHALPDWTDVSNRVLEPHIDSGERFIVLDLAGVPFCDPAGLNAALAPRRHAHEPGARLALARAQGQLRQLLKLTGADRTLDVYDAAQDAVTNLASHCGDNSRNERNIGP